MSVFCSHSTVVMASVAHIDIWFEEVLIIAGFSLGQRSEASESDGLAIECSWRQDSKNLTGLVLCPSHRG